MAAWRQRRHTDVHLAKAHESGSHSGVQHFSQLTADSRRDARGCLS